MTSLYTHVSYNPEKSKTKSPLEVFHQSFKNKTLHTIYLKTPNPSSTFLAYINKKAAVGS